MKLIRILFLIAFHVTLFLSFSDSFAIQSQRPIILRLATWEGGEGQNAMRKTLKEFESAHPHIKVKVEAPGYHVYIQKLLVQYAANAAPDVAILSSQCFRQFASRGALLPLDPLISETEGFDLSKYYKIAIKELRHERKLYVLPRDIGNFCFLFYNKRLFDEAGLPYPNGSWTWDYKVRPELKEKDFLWNIQQLTKFDKNHKPTQWGLSAYMLKYLADNFALSSGAEFADDPNHPKKLLFNSPKVIKAYQFTADLVHKHQWVPSKNEVRNVFQTNPRNMWLSQKVALYLNGIWDVANMRAFLKKENPSWFDWDITLFPAYKDGTRKYFTGTAGYTIFSSTKHPKEAWKLIQWLSGKPGMNVFSQAGLAHPARKDLALSAPWMPNSNTPQAEQYPKSRHLTHQAVQYSWMEPRSKFWPELTSLIGMKLANLWNGYQKAEDVLNEANADAQHHLDTLLKKESLPNFNWSMALVFGVICAGFVIIWVYYPEQKIKYSKTQKRESRIAYLFLSPWLIGVIVFTLGPILFSLIMSLSDWDIIEAAKWNGLQNYVEAFKCDTRFWISLKVTFLYTLISVPFGVFFALLLALMLNIKIRGTSFFRTCFYLPSLASIVVTCLVWRKIFQTKGGLINTFIYGSDGTRNLFGLGQLLSQFGTKGEPIDWLGNESTALAALIMMSFWGIGSSMVILLAGLQHIPKTYIEASILDGASSFQRLKKIILPLLSPSIWFCIVTGVIISFQVFTKAFVLTDGGPGDSTRFYVLYLYNQAFDLLRMGYASALAWILFVIIFVFTLLQIKMSRWVHYEAEIK